MLKHDTKKLACRNQLLCIDPGLGGTGLAFWDRLDQDLLPTETHVIKCSQNIKDLVDRCDVIATKIEQKSPWFPRYALIEFPKPMASQKKGIASLLKGDLLKLSYLCGVLADRLTQMSCTVHLITPDWKGSMNKKVLARRLTKALGRTFKNHEADAVGMGLALMGKL